METNYSPEYIAIQMAVNLGRLDLAIRYSEGMNHEEFCKEIKLELERRKEEAEKELSKTYSERESPVKHLEINPPQVFNQK